MTSWSAWIGTCSITESREQSFRVVGIIGTKREIWVNPWRDTRDHTVQEERVCIQATGKHGMEKSNLINSLL